MSILNTFIPREEKKAKKKIYDENAAEEEIELNGKYLN